MENQMENEPRVPFQEKNTDKMSSLFSDNRNWLIMFLSILLLLSVLGVTFINTFFDWLKAVIGTIAGFFGSVIGNFFYASGDIINASTNTVADAAKISIDLGSGAINDVGNLMKSGVTGEEIKKIPVSPVVVITPTTKPTDSGKLDEIIEKATKPPSREHPVEPSPTPPENPIQKSHQSNQTAWCLVGNQHGNRSCMEIDPSREQCVSGEVFNTGKKCINP
jgi:hypothetical protein